MNNDIHDGINYLVQEFSRYYPQWIKNGMISGSKEMTSVISRLDRNLTKPMAETATNIKALNKTMNSLATTMGKAVMFNVKAAKDETTYKKIILEQLKKEAISRKESVAQIDKAIKSMSTMVKEIDDVSKSYDDLQKTISKNEDMIDSLNHELQKLDKTTEEVVKSNTSATKAVREFDDSLGKAKDENDRYVQSIKNAHFAIERFALQVAGNLKNTQDAGEAVKGAGHTMGLMIEGVADLVEKKQGILGAAISNVAGMVRMVSGAYGELISTATEQRTIFRDLNRAGILLSARFDESAYMAQRNAIDQASLTKVLIQNATLFSKSSTASIEKFAKVSDMATQAASMYSRLGMSQEETMDYIAKYIDSMKIVGTYNRNIAVGTIKQMADTAFSDMVGVAKFFGKELTDILKTTNEFMRKGETQAQLAMFMAGVNPAQRGQVKQRVSEMENFIGLIDLPEEQKAAMRNTYMRQLQQETGGLITPEMVASAQGLKSTSPEIAAVLEQMASLQNTNFDPKVAAAQLLEATQEFERRDLQTGFARTVGTVGADSAVKTGALTGYGLAGYFQGTTLQDFFEKISTTGDIISGSPDGKSPDVLASQALLEQITSMNKILIETQGLINTSLLNFSKSGFVYESFNQIIDGLTAANEVLASASTSIAEAFNSDLMTSMGANLDKIAAGTVIMIGLLSTIAGIGGIGLVRNLFGGRGGKGGGIGGRPRREPPVRRSTPSNTNSAPRVTGTPNPNNAPKKSGGFKFPSLGGIGGALSRASGPLAAGLAFNDLFGMYINANRLGGSELDAARQEAERQSQMMNDGMNVYGFAQGGVITGPTMGILAEAGRPEMVMPLDPSMSDLAKHIAEKHLMIVGPYMRQINNELIYRQFRENRDVIDEIFTVSLDKFFFSKMEVQQVFDQINSGRSSESIRRTMNIMEQMGINVRRGALTSAGIDRDYPNVTGQSGYSGSYSSDRGQMALDLYNAFVDAGMSDAQARAMVAQINRENHLNPKHIFGQHIDPANNAVNIGMMSWQGDRGRNLLKFMRERGLIDPNGNMLQSKEAIAAQAQFMMMEMQNDPAYERTKRLFLGNENISRSAADVILGDNFIRWRRTDPAYAESGNRSIAEGYGIIDSVLSGGNNVVMANQNAGRNGQVDPNLIQNISRGVSQLFGPGHVAEIYSGGNDPNNPIGQNRHNNGQAADIRIRAPDGTYLTGNQNAVLAQWWLANNLGSAGAGMGAGGTGLHLDLMTQDRLQPGQGLSWTYDNATKGQIAALNAGRQGIMPNTPYMPNSFMNAVMSPTTATNGSGMSSSPENAMVSSTDRVVAAINNSSDKIQAAIRGQAVAIAKSQGKIIGPQ